MSSKKKGEGERTKADEGGTAGRNWEDGGDDDVVKGRRRGLTTVHAYLTRRKGEWMKKEDQDEGLPKGSEK